MEAVFYLAQFVLGIGVILFLIWPMLRSFGTSYQRLREGDDSSKKRMVIDALSDIEYEHETGKINDRDYERLREHYLREAADVFDEDELESTPDVDDDSSDSLEERIQRERERLT